MPPKDELLQNIHKEIQQEKWLAVWRDYKALILASIVVVAGSSLFAGYWLYDYHLARQNASHHLLQTLYRIDKSDAAEKDWEDLYKLQTNPQQKKWPIHSLNYVTSLVNHSMAIGEPEKALAVLETADSVAFPYFDQLLVLLKGQAYVIAKERDKAEQTLQSLTDARSSNDLSPSSVWRYIALEWLAELAWQSGDTASAFAYLKTISDDLSAPPLLRERAARMLNILSS